jgi:hypothetical protein
MPVKSTYCEYSCFLSEEAPFCPCKILPHMFNAPYYMTQNTIKLCDL